MKYKYKSISYVWQNNPNFQDRRAPATQDWHLKKAMNND